MLLKSATALLPQDLDTGDSPTFAGLTVGSLDGIIIGTSGVLSAITNNSSNWDTAYTHSQDNSQAHSDYLVNNANDSTTGKITFTVTGRDSIVAQTTRDGSTIRGIFSNSTLTGSGNGVAGVNAQGTSEADSGTVNEIAGGIYTAAWSYTSISDTITVTRINALRTSLSIIPPNNGTATDAMGLYIPSPGGFGSGTLLNAYGIYIESFNANFNTVRNVGIYIEQPSNGSSDNHGLWLADNTTIALGTDADNLIDFDSVLSVGMFDGGNWLVNSTNQLQFGDNGTYIYQANDGHLDLVADVSIDANAIIQCITGDGSNRIFEFSTDATDPTSGGGAATGRVPVLIGGVTRYLAYY